MMKRLFFELRYLLGRTPWDTQITPPEVQSFLEEHAPGRAIDLGCGTGTNVLTMAQYGWEVTGIDFSSRAIDKARRRLRNAGVHAELLQGDVVELSEVQGPFDLALDIGCFYSLRSVDRVRYTSRLAELVRYGGVYLLYTFLNPMAQPSGWPSKAEVLELLQPAFDLEAHEPGLHQSRPSGWFTFRHKH